MSFVFEIDIANRALDHCGQDPIDETLGFAENSKKARLCGRLYDKLRLAELQRRPWSFATVVVILRAIDINTMRLMPALWSSSATYFIGSIVSTTDGMLWICNTPSSINNEPQSSTAWDQYFGPLTVSLYSSDTTYNTGELVYTAPGDGTYRVYLSRINGNDDNPATATAWDATSVYSKNRVVTDASIAYMSRIDLNQNQTPAATTALDWDTAVTYAIGDKVCGADGLTYTSLVNGNVGINPIFSPASWSAGSLTPWTTSFTAGIGSDNWLQIGGAEFPFGVGLETMQPIYPLGAGPTTQSSTRNAYHVPAGYLRKTSRDPRAGSTSYLGAPWGMDYQDWKFENQYIVTAQVGPIMLRFIANVVDVRRMTPMFCEGLAARMAVDMVEPLTQSTEKLKGIAEVYKHFMGEAGTVDAIDRGPDEFPVDDYIQARY